MAQSDSLGQEQSIDNLPKALFKYVDPVRIDILENLEIRYTPRSAFNDPFDLLPVVEEMDEKVISTSVRNAFLRDYWRKVFAGENVPRQDIFLKTHVGEAFLLANALRSNTDWIKQQAAERLASRLDYTVGVLCLTAIENDLLMWGHYAAKHTGFVIEFDPPKLNLQSINVVDFVSSGLVKVVYSDKRPVMPWLGELRDPAIFATKSTHWNYEQEWRGFRKLDTCDRKINVGQGVIHLFKLPGDSIRRVIVGCRMSLEDRERLNKAISGSKRIKDVKIEVAKPDLDKFALQYSSAK